MNIKRLLSLLMVLCMLLGICTSVYSAGASASADIEKLCAFGILENKIDNLSRPVERIEMVRYVVGLYGTDASFIDGETGYTDVPADNKYAGAINRAKLEGIVSSSEYFYPDRTVKFEEAVKMILVALGYKELAERSGGYPNGYIKIATDIGLLKGVQAGEGSGLTLVSCVKLLDNALSCKVCNISYTFGSADDGDTVLAERFSGIKYSVYVKEINDAKNTIVAQIRSIGKDVSTDYEVGDDIIFEIGDTSVVDDCKYAIADVYADNENKIYYLKNHRNIEVVSDHILEINESANKAPNNPAMMETLAFESSEEYIEFADNCNIFYNGKAVDNKKSYSFIGSFARAVIYNDEIIALEAWSLKEGGLISSVGISDIIYQKGDIKNLELKNLSSYDEVNIILNGEKAEIYSLDDSCVFDYYKEGDKSLLIVASSIAITDTLESIESEGLRIGSELYPLSSSYNVYVSADGENFRRNSDITELASRTVMAYLDSAGYVRYVKPVLDDELSKEYFAIIMGFEEEMYQDSQVLMYVFKDDTVEKGVYTLPQRIEKRNSDLIDYIKAETKNLAEADSALKNDAIKNADLFYKVKINDKGELVKITVPTRFSEPTLNDNYANGTDGLLFNSAFTTLATPHIVTPKISFPEAKICLFYYSEENGVQVRLVEWKDISGRACSGILITPFAEHRSSKIDFMLLRGDAESLKITRGDYVKRGLCTDIRKGYDKETESEHLILKVDGKDYIASKYKDMFADVTDAAYILYSEGNSLIKNNEIVPVTIFNLSGKPDSWALSGARKEGLHRDEIDFIDSERIYFKSGEVWYFADGAPVYEIVETNGKVKFIESSRGSVPEGADCWYIFQYYEARALFYVR